MSAALPSRWKDYRAKGRTRYKTMTVSAAEFMRRFLLHVVPSGFHRIRHYGLLSNPRRKANLATVRKLLQAPTSSLPDVPAENPHDAAQSAHPPVFLCRHCGAPMLILQTLTPIPYIRGPPSIPCS